MAKTVLPAAVLVVTLAALLVLATPAYPQVVGSEGLAADEEGNLVGPRPPEYQVTEDGTLIVGGDVLVKCVEVGLDDYPPGADDPAVRVQIERSPRESARACRAAGFATATEDSLEALPETGGAPPLLLAGLLFLGSIGLIAIQRAR